MNEVSEIMSMVESRLIIKSEETGKDIEDFRPPPDITDLQTVLKTEESSKGKDFIFRKGISSDVFESSKDEENLEGKIFILDRHLIGYLNFQSVLT